MARSSVSRLARLLVSVLVAVALPLTPWSAFAWGAKAHEIIAYMAEAHLSEISPKKDKRITPEKWLPSSGVSMGDREGRKIELFTPFHFVDVPRIPTTARETAPTVTVSLKPLPGICTFLPWMMQP